MDDTYRVLSILLRFLEIAYTNSSVNRKNLHEIEWKAEESSPSILGEIEVRADAVIGITRGCLKRKPGEIDKLIDTLEVNSVYQSEFLVHWLAYNGDDFPDFLLYITAIENLRLGTIAFLKRIE